MARGGVDIDITLGGDYKKSLAVIKLIGRRMRRGIKRGLRNLGVVTAREIRTRYKRGHSLPLSYIAKRKRAIGKKAGKWPPIPQYPGTKPLHRSGMLAAAVDQKPTTGTQKEMEHITYVKGHLGAFAGSGAPLNLSTTAMLQETGFTASIPVSFRMRNYLRVLAGSSKGGAGGGRTPEGFTGKILAVRVPARPIWGPYFNELVPQRASKLMIEGWIKGLGLKGVWS